MPAHVPRRIFTRSLVVTMAALPACGGERPAPRNPPPPEVAPQPAPAASVPAATATATPTNPPAPSESSAAVSPTPTPAGASSTRWTVERNGAKCVTMLEASCPPNVDCNPPPPSAYPCPKEIPASIERFDIERAAGSQTCRAHAMEIHKGSCPPLAHCNPPPPRHIDVEVPCPK